MMQYGYIFYVDYLLRPRQQDIPWYPAIEFARLCGAVIGWCFLGWCYEWILNILYWPQSVSHAAGTPQRADITAAGFFSGFVGSRRGRHWDRKRR